MAWNDFSLNKSGTVGVEPIGKPNSAGGVDRYNELKFGRLGKIDMPTGVSEYQRTAKGPPARGSSPQANTQNVKGMQMKALQSAYKPTGPTSNGKGVGP